MTHANYTDFPQPPSQSTICVERDLAGITLACTRDMKSFGVRGVMVKVFFVIWTGMVLGLMGLGVFLGYQFGKDFFIQPEGQPLGIGLLFFVGFMVLWFGMLSVFLWTGLRAMRVVSRNQPIFGWQLRLEQNEWTATRYGFLLARRKHCDPSKISGFALDRKRQVVAELNGRQLALTTPMSDFEADWLRKALGQMVGVLAPATVAALPFVPCGDLSTSPGSRLAIQLTCGSSAAKSALGCLFATLCWNGVVSIFVVLAVQSHIGGYPEWVLTIISIPLVLIGLALIVTFIHRLLVATGVGPTLAEISSHPLYSGERCRVFISQSGKLTMNSLRVFLVSEEEATYQEGTATRTESRRVFEQELFKQERFQIEKERPYETEFDLQLPAGAMHSFEASYNKIRWKLVVRGDVAGWPNYERNFPVVVYPPKAKGDKA